MKFTCAGGSIEVRLERDGAAARITVTDTGQGIRPDFLPFVFDRFRQNAGGEASPAITAASGLGLAIAKQLVELHGGTIDAHSAGEGLGATFSVRLPLVAAAPRISSSPLGAAARGNGRSPTSRGVSACLVTGYDLDDTRALAVSALEACGAAVEVVASAADGRARHLARAVPDVLLADLAARPAADAAGARARVARAPVRARRPRTRRGAHRRLQRGGAHARAARAGFDVHVAKPIDPAELIAAVASLSGRV